VMRARARCTRTGAQCGRSGYQTRSRSSTRPRTEGYPSADRGLLHSPTCERTYRLRGGLHYSYHHLVCGDWWDEDPCSPQYNHLVHVRCTVRSAFAAWSKALWRETVTYPYFAVVQFNMNPIVAGAKARGAGIFLHSWVGGATEGCVALPEARLLEVLRWLESSAHSVIEIGTDSQIEPVPPAPPAIS